MKKVIVLAGGSDQIELIKELKSRNYYVILIDYFENPPAKEYADFHYVASTMDEERVEEIAIDENIDLVTTACTDQALLTVAKVSEKLNLPCYINYETALSVTNKLYMKKLFTEGKIPTAPYRITSNAEINIVHPLRYPLVVKPVDCNSSKGVKKVLNEEELIPVLNNAIALSRTHTAIVENYIDGYEISADFWVEGGKAIFLSATQSDKIKNNGGAFTILSSYYEPLSDQQINKLQEIGQQIVDTFNLSNCPFFVQLINKDNNYFVLEFSARMGGGSKYYLINQLTGLNIMKIYVNCLLKKDNIITPSLNKKYLKMCYCYCSSGIIKSYEGFEDLKNNGHIIDFFIYKSIGSEITKHETSSDRPIGFLIEENTFEELTIKEKFVYSKVKILNQNNENILIDFSNN